MLEIRPVPLDHPDAQRLVGRALAFYVELYGGEGDTDPMDTGAFAAPNGAFYVGYLDGVPVVTGGWRSVDVERLGATRAAEIKRMYVADEARGLGLARTMLAHLETTARAAGCDVLVLSTGAPQVAAVGLYASAGYEPIEPFGYYADSPNVRCFGKRL
ncbi:GNAT family N-acetyltransferase [Nocardioides sp. BP30]|uniref:GNAT family N-acetyltransferase n=1 Tax=Nocardioides sp. BP30 TaxID=3036374 RepID=UPI0024695161|nr:GNAT family N-acetyltransferase [Nocardioides sp. BP30]WGL51987.1 GNAT family N-acetyltransferase [Nocardioides sp. BP30]